jgi:(4-(4-[2-(gamma-L-glutamylamino)ethyl]phenoxymethyl)furan-2-yl)methanamine synthase
MKLGLDIGGANLKVAHTNGTARTVPFELWKQPWQLPLELAALVASAPPHDGVAVTMTGELCDCFETKRQGVHAIVDAVEVSCLESPNLIWRNDGQWVDCATARQTPYQVAAANWLALATFAGRFAGRGPGLLIDIGSTTTDIIPLFDGKPIPQGRTDSERLASGELVYRGVRRTPLLWCAQTPVAAELFATTLDVFLLLERIQEDPEDRRTADGRPATRNFAQARLARMLGSDGETCSEAQTLELAHSTVKHLGDDISQAMNQVIACLPALPLTVVIAGSGEFFAAELVERQRWAPSATVESLTARLGAEVSSAACAYAVAILAEEHSDGR